VENLLPIKCHKIKYFEDKIFTSRLLPAPQVAALDVSTYRGSRTDDHFALWQQRIEPGAVVHPASALTPEADRSEALDPAPATEFSLDFSTVRIPPGRYLTGPEIDGAVQSFLDQLESA